MSERDPSSTPPLSGTPARDAPGHASPGQPPAGSTPYSGESYDTTPHYSTSPVTVRRPDAPATLLLVLAGIAAAVSLVLDWVDGSSGWDLVADGFQDFDAGSWQPPVIVLAGGALLVLGLLCLLPARSHKTPGTLALLATMAAAGGVLVALDATRFSWDAFAIGFWFALAVPVLGLLGSLKAMLTGPRTT